MGRAALNWSTQELAQKAGVGANTVNRFEAGQDARVSSVERMTTADWALVISLCSFFVSLACFIWNVWSKFIYPKAKVSVHFSVNTIIGGSDDGFKVISLLATNLGPGNVTLYLAVDRSRKRWFKKVQLFILNPLHDFPIEKITHPECSAAVFRRKSAWVRASPPTSRFAMKVYATSRSSMSVLKRRLAVGIGLPGKPL
ncbi:helix-turn-helix domain-containing protein [Ensifer sesbaniae]|uniref:helix-turn-helix domain-containing protein n=1 Tax=Ensifer sesbaniae TaxID=1214071 RepID=UPI001568FF3C|nr:helix-turn-helix transcriptional regulator [Ensifer sesbaniae]MCK3777222.1 helix-turn-helix domain-containing protein [Ensifer sesbaniae]